MWFRPTLAIFLHDSTLCLPYFLRASLQINSPAEGLDGRVFMFPLAVEACIKECGSPPEYAQARAFVSVYVCGCVQVWV